MFIFENASNCIAKGRLRLFGRYARRVLQANCKFRNVYEIHNFQFVDKIFIQSQSNSGEMPEQLCTQCEAELIGAYVFRKRCEKAVDQLLNFIRSDTEIFAIKTESPLAEEGYVHAENSCDSVAETHAGTVSELLNNVEIWIATDEAEQFEPNADGQTDGLAFDGSDELIKTKAEATENETAASTKQRANACEECSKSFSRPSHLKRHMMVHTDERPFVCSKCDKRFRRADYLQIHQDSHTEVKPHKCEYCSRGFSRAEHLRSHIWTRHKELAGVKTDSERYIERKVWRTIPARKSFICTDCDRTFATNECLDAHRKTHSIEHKMRARPLRNERSEKQFLCSECGMTFVRNDYLVVHMRRHNGERPFKCNYCDKRFPRSTDLKTHERYHTGEKLHLCNMCGKGFQRAYNLLVHMRIHTGERPYQCSQCSKSFAQSNDLKAHFRRHTGERYRCDVCGEGFIQGYHLTQHRKSAHGIDMLAHTRRVEKIPLKPPDEDRDECDDINQSKRTQRSSS